MVVSTEKTIKRAPQTVNISNKRVRTYKDIEDDTRNVNARNRKKRSAKFLKTVGSLAENAAIKGNNKENGIDEEVRLIRHTSSEISRTAKKVSQTSRKKNNKGEDDTEYSGRIEADETEYTGRKKKHSKKDTVLKPAVSVISAVATQLLILAKLIVTAITNMLIVAAILIVVVVVATVTIVQNATYDFLVDEEAHIRELVSNVANEVSNNIILQKNENGCSKITSSGELADWREVIALWWTLKTHLSENQEWDNYFSSDQEDIRYIFNQFNRIEYEVVTEAKEDGTEEKVLKVTISTTTLDDLRVHWGLDASQNEYLDSVLADEELWEELLSVSGLANIAIWELGNGISKYREWYGDSSADSAVFVAWCMNQAGVSKSYIDVPANVNDFLTCLENKGMIINSEPEEGDIVFVDSGEGSIACGIITRKEKDIIYVAIAGKAGNVYVTEYTYDITSKAIKSVAHINGFFVEALVSSRKFNWPVDGYYYVTSAYGPRDLEGTTFHHGLDIGCDHAAQIFAADSGKVVEAAYNTNLGFYVVIDHGKGVKTVYGHNTRLNVSAGEYVKRGQTIAYAGNTGFSFGTHCHFAVQIDGEYVNPAPYLGLPEKFTGDASEYVK